MSIIKNRDIYDESQGNPLQSIIDVLNLLDKKIIESANIMKKLEKAIKEANGENTGEYAKELALQTAKLEAETKKLVAIEKTKLDIEKKLAVEQEKLTQLRNGGAEALAKVKLETQKLNKEKLEEQKLTSELTTEYEKEVIRLSQLKKEIKDLVIQGKTEDALTKAKIKDYQELNNKIRSVEEIVGEFQRNVGNYPKVLVPARQELRKLTQELTAMKLAGKDGTEEYRIMAQKAGQLKDSINDARAEIKLFASDTRNLDLAVGAIKAVGSAFQVAEGAAALLGVENEDLTKSIQKMVAVQSILNGLTEIQNALQTESAFMQGVLAVKTKIAAAAQWLWNAAMSANPIGLIVTAVVALGAAIGGLILWFNKSTDASEEQNVALDGTVHATKELVKAHNEHLEALRKLDVQLALTKGNITDFEAAIIDLAAEYNTQIESINADTEEKLGEVNGFWNTLWNSVKSGGSVIGGITKNATEGAKVVIEQEKKKQYAQEILNKKLEIEQAKRDKQIAEDNKKLQEKLSADKLAAQQYDFELERRLNLAMNAEDNKLIEQAQTADQLKLESTRNTSEEILNYSKDLAAQQSEIRAKQLEEEKERQLEFQESIKETAKQAGEAFGVLLAEGKLTAESFSKLMIISVLKVAKAQLMEGIFGIWVHELSTKGFAGAVSAALLTGIVEGLFAGAERKIMALAGGTEYVNGAGTETSDSIPARLSKGERVVPANINKQLAGISNADLPKIVYAGQNYIRLENIMKDVNNNTSMAAQYLSIGKNYWTDGQYNYIQDFSTGITHRIPINR